MVGSVTPHLLAEVDGPWGRIQTLHFEIDNMPSLTTRLVPKLRVHEVQELQKSKLWFCLATILELTKIYRNPHEIFFDVFDDYSGVSQSSISNTNLFSETLLQSKFWRLQSEMKTGFVFINITT